MSKFKIKNIGIDTTQLDYSPSENNFSHVHTSISANNDFEINEYIKQKEDSVLITSIDFLDKCDVAIINHLQELEREKINLLLVDASCDLVKYADTLNDLLERDIIGEIGLKNPNSVDDIKKAMETLSQLRFVSLDICPLNFNYDIIDWCNKNNIDIIGFNPLGGYFSYTNIINSFTVPYLLGFAAYYCTIVFLSGRDPLLAEEDRTYLEDLINRESEQTYIFELNKNVFKLNKPLKRTISTYLSVLGDNTIYYDNPFSLYSYYEIQMTLGDKDKDKLINLHKREEKDTLEEAVENYFNEIEVPEDATSPGDAISIVRPKILDLARIEYSDIDGWMVGSFKIDENTYIISAVRKLKVHRFLRKAKTELEKKNYILYYNDVDEDFFFSVIQNTEETA